MKTAKLLCGGVIKKMRLAAKMTRYQLAQLTGLDQSCLMRLEADTNEPSILSALKIVKALGHSLSAFDLCDEKREAKKRKSKSEPAEPVSTTNSCREVDISRETEEKEVADGR